MEKSGEEEKSGAEGVEERGLEGVWRGASRHQSLIICRPIPTTHLLMSGGGVKAVWEWNR